MLGLNPGPGLEALIDFEFPMSDIIAVAPYVIPMIFIGITLLLYQRHLDPESRVRNAMVLSGLVLVIGSCLVLLYAGFGAVWWGPDTLTFGSWYAFVAVVQGLTNVVFGSVFSSIAYLAGVAVIFLVLAHSVISPPDPDFVKLRQQLKEASENAKVLESEVQRLEGEKKQLADLLNEKEEKLAAIEGELTALKQKVSDLERERADLLAQPPSEGGGSDMESELLETIAKKDQTITRLQAEVEELRAKLQSAAPGADAERMKKIQAQLDECQARIESFTRRAETAAEVTESMISELAELITQVEGSSLDDSAKKTLATIIENMGRSVGRISRPEAKTEEPRVELIGAVMMVHEVVDSIKRMARSGSE